MANLAISNTFRQKERERKKVIIAQPVQHLFEKPPLSHIHTNHVAGISQI